MADKLLLFIIIDVLIKVTLSHINIKGALYGKLQNTKRQQAVAGLVTKGRLEQYYLPSV